MKGKNHNGSFPITIEKKLHPGTEEKSDKTEDKITPCNAGFSTTKKRHTQARSNHQQAREIAVGKKKKKKKKHAI
jgi:hypothetical protein